MLVVREVHLRRVEFDMRSAGMSVATYDALEGASVELINAKQLVAVEEPATQVVVCSECGHTGCSSRGWVVFRTVGSVVLWLPYFDGIDETHEWWPPPYLAEWQCGAVVFPTDVWAQARLLNPALPPVEDIKPLTRRELARALQWGAPSHLLGLVGSQPHVDQDLVAAVLAEGDALPQVNRLLVSLSKSNVPVRTVASHEAIPVGFAVEAPGTPLWYPFADLDGELVVVIDEVAGIFATV